MIDSVFLANDVTAGPDILGLRLLPLSIWHVWALKASSNPFATGGKYDIESFCNALLICTLSKSQFDELVRTDALAVYKGHHIAPAILTADEDTRAEALGVFLEYFDACTVYPEFWEDDKSDPVKDRLRCPSEWHLVASLLRMRIAQTEAEAWDYPIAKAHCWVAVEGERNGSKNYVDQRDRNDFDQLKKDHVNG
jgi:hypothetical protein